MDFKDFFLAPLFLGLYYALAFAMRRRYTNIYTRKYFIPALTLKFIGAISLGLIYQFYYKGGDTFNYYMHVEVVNQAFSDSFATGLKLLTANGQNLPELYPYTSQMFWWQPNSTEFFIVRIAAVIGLLCFNSYSVIALTFAFISFCGMWAMYITFVRIYPAAYKNLAIAVFFLPSVFFWGSGLMKDSLCIGALGWTFYGFYNVFIIRKNVALSAVLGLLGAYILISAKIYILMSFMAPALLWVFNENSSKIKSPALRVLIKPVLIVIGATAGYFASVNLTAGDERFDVEKIGERSKITKEYLSTYVASGSAYDIGELDGSIASIVRVAPQAVFISLFRPFLFEVRNPVMLLSALEATMFLYFAISLVYKTGLKQSLRLVITEPILSFCFLFAIILAIGVGTTSGNFGTLVRYKIPLMPFFLAGLYIMQSRAQALRQPQARGQRRMAA